MNSFKLIESAWTLTIVAVVALVMWTLLGCASPSPCLKPAVTLERPALPAVPAARLQCLDDATYATLIDRICGASINPGKAIRAVRKGSMVFLFGNHSLHNFNCPKGRNSIKWET